MAAHGDDLIDIHKRTVGQGTYLTIGIARSCTYIQSTGSEADHTLGYHLVSRFGLFRNCFLRFGVVFDLIILIRRRHGFVVAQAYPTTLFQKAPFHIVGGDIIRHDVHGCAALDRSGGLCALLGLLINLQLLGGSTGIAGFSTQNIAAAVHIAFALLPVDIEFLAVMAVVQGVHPFSAGRLCVPAQETVTGSGALGHRGRTQLTVVAQNADSSGGTEEHGSRVVEQNIVIIGGDLRGINTVQVEIRLNQAALHQGLQDFSAGIGPEAEGGQEFVSGGTIDDCLCQHMGLRAVRPAAAHIICKGHQCIELGLGEVQIVLRRKFVDSVNIILHLIQQKLLGFFFRNTIFLIVFHFIVRTLGTIAHTPLGVVPVGIFPVSFEIFNQIDARIAGFHGCCRMGRHGEHAYQHNQRQHKNKSFAFHRSFLLCLHNIGNYIIKLNKTQELQL